MAETEETEFSVNDNCKACESVLSTSVVPSVEVSLKTIDGPVTFTPPLCPKKAVLGGRQVPPMSKAASTASGNNFDFGKGALKHSDHCNSHSGVCRCAPSAHMVPEHHGDPKQLCLKKLSLMTQRKIDHSTNLPLCLSSSEYLSNSYKIPPADRIEFRTNTLVDYVVTSLRKFGWCWIDSFLGPNHADKVLEEVDHLYQRQTFQDGQLAKPAGPFAQLVRTDKIRWYDQKSDGESNSPVNVLLSMIDYVVMAASPLLCNRICGRSKVGRADFNKFICAFQSN